MSKRAGCWLALAVWSAACAQGQVTLTQRISLEYGWNAVYLEVAPEGAPDEVFGEWPADTVGLYDPASFLPSRQFGEGTGKDPVKIGINPVATWYRHYPEASDAMSIPAGTVAMAFSTNEAATELSIRGVPAAPRTTWHVTGAKDAFNCLGVSLQKGSEVEAGDYMDGFPGNNRQEFYLLSGKRAGGSPTLIPVFSRQKLGDGAVLMVPSDRISDWTGVLYVSPMQGVDFGQTGTKVPFSVRNDGGAARTVALELLRPSDVGETGTWGKFQLPDEAVKVREPSFLDTWRPALQEGEGRRVDSKRLEPGETWNLEFGLDRAALPAAVKGDAFGALLRVTDEDGKSMMRVDVPLVGEASGADAERTAWPGGLWLADVAFDRVTAPGASEATETGGKAKVRLPIHIDTNGTIRLLQRVVAAGSVDADGEWTYRLYAGTSAPPATATAAMRVSAVTLPTEVPVVVADAGSGLREGVSFSFTVSADGPTSLLRHPLHPQHDGLQWDFKTPAPSGDDFRNYQGDVKPETFSVRCRIELSLDLDGGEAAWNPEGTKTGTCRWTFSGLMRQGDVSVEGPMSIERVSPVGEIVVE